MKTPIFTIVFLVIVTLCFLIYDSLMARNWIELVQDISFLVLGGIFSWQIRIDNKKKNSLIDSDKLAVEVIQDENKQLKEKMKTLEAALDKLVK